MKRYTFGVCMVLVSMVYSNCMTYLGTVSHRDAQSHALPHPQESLYVQHTVQDAEKKQRAIGQHEAVAVVTEETIPKVSDGIYVVQSGDTLTTIADTYKTSVESIAAVNGLANWDEIWVGQVLSLSGQMPPPPTPDSCDAAKQIYVMLSTQKLYAFEHCELVRTFVVSTGISQYPTVIGDYATYVKLDTTRMTGPGYDLPDVKWTMYFYLGYGIHGKDWNDIYGRPTSHGCVNMTLDDAEWMYNWAPVGTPVHTRER